MGKTVPPVAGTAAGIAAGAAPEDDVNASTTPFDDTSGKTRVPVIASAAGAAAASATAVVGADCYADPARTGNEDSLQRHGVPVPPDNLLHLPGRHSD